VEIALFRKARSEASAAPESAEAIEARERREQLEQTVRVLLFCLKEFSFDLIEIQADRFQRQLDEYAALLPDANARQLRKAIDARRPQILDFIRREQDYFRAREAELKQMVRALLEGVEQAAGDDRAFQSQILAHNSRVERATQLDDLRRVRDVLRAEVRQIADAVHEKQRHDADRVERLSAEVSTLRADLEREKEAAYRDALTGVYNRGALDRHLAALVERVRHGAEPFAVLLCDLDDFKLINDTHGHPVGDRVLRCFAVESRALFRDGDFIARYGGEEFLVVLPGATLRGAHKRATALCRSLAGRKYLIDPEQPEKTIRFTVSVGVARFREGDDAATLITRADQALYAAKSRGKNRAIREDQL
jgi:diguanylate cyclase (GGDEF)-like protein